MSLPIFHSLGRGNRLARDPLFIETRDHGAVHTGTIGRGVIENHARTKSGHNQRRAADVRRVSVRQDETIETIDAARVQVAAHDPT